MPEMFRLWSGVISCLLLILASSALGQVIFPENETNVGGLVLRGARSEEFRRAVRLLGQDANGATIREMEPYSALVLNASSRPILAAIIHYELIPASGVPSGYVIRCDNFNDPAFMFQPGSSLLITPVGIMYPERSLESDMRSAGRAGGSSGVTGTTAWPAKKALIEGNPKRLAISIDAVLDADGHLFGEDHTRNFDRFRALFRADTDLYGEVKAAFDRGESADAILNGFKSSENAVPRDRSDTPEYAYVRRKGMMRLALWLRIQTQGRDGIKEWLVNMARGTARQVER
jgi:hypothetical protein